MENSSKAMMEDVDAFVDATDVLFFAGGPSLLVLEGGVDHDQPRHLADYHVRGQQSHARFDRTAEGWNFRPAARCGTLHEDSVHVAVFSEPRP